MNYRKKNKFIVTLLNKQEITQNVETRCVKSKLFVEQNPIQGTIKHKPTINQKNNGASKIPKIEIIGDSHLNALKPRGLSKHNNAIVRII